MNRDELIEKLERSRENFLELVEDLDDAAMVEVLSSDQWSIKDILAHLARWEAELVKLLWQLRQGQRPTTALFTGDTVDATNARWQEEDRTRPLERILTDFHGVRNQTLRRLEGFTDRELNDEKRFPWLNSTPLWQWVASHSFEHEAEHIASVQEIRSTIQSQPPYEVENET